MPFFSGAAMGLLSDHYAAMGRRPHRFAAPVDGQAELRSTMNNLTVEMRTVAARWIVAHTLEREIVLNPQFAKRIGLHTQNEK
jgi:hypothetical protein